MSDIPRHIGFIVDGNRRWAKQHGLPAYEGHMAGYNALQDVLLETLEQGVKYVSAYVFSTENWKRSEDEVGRLMGLILKIFTADLHILQEKNVRLRVLGSKEGVSSKILKAIADAELATENNDGGTLALCFNYGGQTEVVEAVRQIIKQGAVAEDVTVDMITDNLYDSDIPPCDLIVRTSGEQRLSNFMLWRAAYSELLFIDKNWPDMTKEDVIDILEEYKQRGRRFGG